MDISTITPELFVGTTPTTDEDFDRLRELGVRLVINMRVENRPKKDGHVEPIRSVWLPTFDMPLLPIPMWALNRGAKLALETIERGGKVFVHCAAGVHRSVAQAAAILIAQGHPMEDALAQIKAGRPVADPDVWYIRRRIERFAQNHNQHDQD